MSYAGCKTLVPKRPNAVMEMSIATVQKEIRELQHKVDEKEASRNVGTLPASSGDGRPARVARIVCPVGFGRFTDLRPRRLLLAQ